MIRYGENRVYVLDASVTAPAGMAPVTLALRELAAASPDSARFSAGAMAVVRAGPRSTNELARHELAPKTEEVAVRLGTQACAELFDPDVLPDGWSVEVLELAVVHTGLLFVNTILRIVTDEAGATRPADDPLSDWEVKSWRVMAAIEELFPLWEGVLRGLAARGHIAFSTEFPWGTPRSLAGHRDVEPRGDYMADSHFFLTAASWASPVITSRLGSPRWTGRIGEVDITQFWATSIWQTAREVPDAEALLPLMDVDSEFLGEIMVVSSATARYTILLMLLSEGARNALTVSGEELRRLVFKYGYMVYKVREATRLMTEENRRYYEEASRGEQYKKSYEAWRHYEQLVLAAADGQEAAELAQRESTIQMTALAVTLILLLAVVMDAYNFLRYEDVVPPITPNRLFVLGLALVLVGLLAVVLPLLLKRTARRRGFPPRRGS